jgi:hypothetical protein
MQLVCTTMCSLFDIPRQYQPIWERLKKEGTVSITAPRPLHARIIKATTKEKWKDVGFKLQIEPRVAVLSHARKNSILTFFLTYPASKNLELDIPLPTRSLHDLLNSRK